MQVIMFLAVLGTAFQFCRTDAQRDQFLDWIEAEDRLIANRHSDSDDNNPDQPPPDA